MLNWFDTEIRSAAQARWLDVYRTVDATLPRLFAISANASHARDLIDAELDGIRLALSAMNERRNELTLPAMLPPEILALVFSMVAEARFARAQSERKAEEAARSLREAEELVRLMQGQMQQLQQRAEDAERDARDVVGVPMQTLAVGVPKLLGSHAPYAEFVAFVAHVRTLRTAAGQQPPVISTLLHTPFLARLVAEDT